MRKEKMIKVARLAVEGMGGERDNARRLLGELGVDDCGVKELLSEDENGYVSVEFAIKDAFERTLIFQTFFRLFNVESLSYSRVNARRVAVDVPGKHWVKYKLAASSVVLLWRKELEFCKGAFIRANKLFADGSEESYGYGQLSESEAERMEWMASCIGRVGLDDHLGDK